MTDAVTRPPLPPFDAATAAQKVRAAEDGWNGRNPERVALAYSPESRWRNRAEFLQGREAIAAFLARKWARELDYRLIKELWAWSGERIAVRFAYEWHDDSGQWVSLLWQRELGLRRGGSHALTYREHQRSADPGGRSQVPLGLGPAARPTPVIECARPLTRRRRCGWHITDLMSMTTTTITITATAGRTVTLTS